MSSYLVHIPLYVLFFFIGRYSYKFWAFKNLVRLREELLDLHEQVSDELAEVRRKGEENRLKWQAMVNDISALNAMVSDDDPGEWTDRDDAFLASWSSAEK